MVVKGTAGSGAGARWIAALSINRVLPTHAAITSRAGPDTGPGSSSGSVSTR